jgi:hypothetical protein
MIAYRNTNGLQQERITEGPSLALYRQKNRNLQR